MSRHAVEHGNDELERDAYNAAFFELGLRWHWDRATYAGLRERSDEPVARLRHYLQTAQAHLLRAYDADFLAAAIEARKVAHGTRVERSSARSPHSFDWAQARGCELGA